MRGRINVSRVFGRKITKEESTGYTYPYILVYRRILLKLKKWGGKVWIGCI
jgi:hypothetical protein